MGVLSCSLTNTVTDSAFSVCDLTICSLCFHNLRVHTETEKAQ